MKRYMRENFAAIKVKKCPPGSAKRVFVLPDNRKALFHQVDISAGSRVRDHIYDQDGFNFFGRETS
jgi:hypothetical protein